MPAIEGLVLGKSQIEVLPIGPPTGKLRIDRIAGETPVRTFFSAY
jgi:hypothetical protein